MLLDARRVRPGTVLEVPVCIAGGGAAGITLARRLIGSGIGVILLESGGHQLETDTQSLYQGETRGERYFALDVARLRYLGGTTNHWTGWCRPLDPTDFEERDWIPLSGWPLSYEELEPYYRAAQEVCEVGPLDYSAATWAKRTGLTLLPLSGELAETAIWQFSPPTRFGARYRDELEQAPNVETYLYANLVDIETNRKGTRVEQVRVARLDGESFFVRPEVLVLGLGAIENARVLLSSDQGHPGGLGNRHGVVGRYFAEHPHSVVGVLVGSFNREFGKLYTDVVNLPGQALPAVRAALTIPPERLRRHRLLGFSVALESEVRWPPLGKSLAAGVERLLVDLQRSRTVESYQLYLRSEQAPDPESRVTLSSERDRLGMRRVVLNWHVHQRERDSIRRGLELVSAAIGEAGLGRVYSFVHAEDEPRVGSWPEITGGYHHTGTTRMGTDPTHSVVNRNGRLHDVENLYVAGSSVFPTAGFANPTLTIVALALRLGDHLKEVVR
jgi:choline dehydrogenase-like flavoprotein